MTFPSDGYSHASGCVNRGQGLLLHLHSTPPRTRVLGLPALSMNPSQLLWLPAKARMPFSTLRLARTFGVTPAIYSARPGA